MMVWCPRFGMLLGKSGVLWFYVQILEILRGFVKILSRRAFRFGTWGKFIQSLKIAKNLLLQRCWKQPDKANITAGQFPSAWPLVKPMQTLEILANSCFVRHLERSLGFSDHLIWYKVTGQVFFFFFRVEESTKQN